MVQLVGELATLDARVPLEQRVVAVAAHRDDSPAVVDVHQHGARGVADPTERRAGLDHTISFDHRRRPPRTAPDRPARIRCATHHYARRMTRTGRCLCGAVSYELTGDLIATAVCHCEHCQRQSGGAFSVNLVAHESQVSVSGALSVYEDMGNSPDTVHVLRKFCGSCGSPILSALTGTDGIIAVKAGTLDDRTAVKPTIEAWCVDRQPWVELPGMEVSLERE